MKRFYDQHAAKLHYLLIGAWNTVFGYLVFVSLYYATAGVGVHYLVILVVSHVLNVTQAYVLYKRLVFKTAGNFLKEYSRFSAFYWLSFVINVVALPFLVEVLHWDPVISQGVFTVVMAVTSYLWHANYTFSLIR